MENLPSKEIESEQKQPIAEKQKEDKPKTVLDQITDLIPLAGTIELTKEQEDILYKSVDPETVEIRPDGLIYLPWMEYVERLRGAFGMSWAHIPQGSPQIKDNHVMWAFWLIIRGKPASFAVGDQEYFPGNRNMSYGDALEGAKSNSLMRNCKGIGISLELWKPSFIRDWKAKYAEEYIDQGKKKWRKKGSNDHEEPKKETTKSFDWLNRMKNAKVKLGSDRYYEILTGRYSHLHTNEVIDEKEQVEILNEMIAAFKGPKKEGE